MKFKEGDIVIHKMTKKKYMIVTTLPKSLTRYRNQYRVTEGLLNTEYYYMKYLDLYEVELKK